MDVIEAPNPHPRRTDVFLGGGITDCPDWQADVIYLLWETPGTILNPRRSGAFTHDIADEQITWEYHALRTADTVFFWFPMETMCPITLLELGVFTQRKDTRLIVGTHPDYARRFDVIKQLELARPEVVVQDNLFGLVEEYKRSLRNEHQLNPAEKDIPPAQEYQRIEQIIRDELEPLLSSGTLDDLRRSITANYRNVSIAHVNSVIAELAGKEFRIASTGRIFPPGL